MRVPVMIVILVAVGLKPAAQEGSWHYVEVTDAHSQGFGLGLGDLTGDGYADIASCNHFYRNPGGDLSGEWVAVRFPVTVDVSLVTDVDGDERGDVFGSSCGTQYWLEAEDRQGSSWRSVQVGAVSDICNHGTGPQGYLAADLVAGGREEIVMTERESSSGSVIMFSIPARPEAGNWPHVRIASESNGESVAAADFDGDGDLDLGGAWSGGSVCWWENPGVWAPDWTRHEVGQTNSHGAERFAAGDIDGDGHPDIIVSEENMGGADDCHIHWFGNPGTDGQWRRATIGVQNGTFGMSAGDVDGDGDLDVVSGENGRGGYDGTEETVVWANEGAGESWEKRVVATGMESHHGSRVYDMDADGDFDLVSICFDTHELIHLWRNDSPVGVRWRTPCSRRSRSVHVSPARAVDPLGRGGYPAEARWRIVVTPGRMGTAGSVPRSPVQRR